MHSKFRGIIFDLGNVIIDIHFDRCFRFWSRHSNVSEAKIATWFSEDSYYRQHERGEIEIDAYHRHVCRSLDLNINKSDFMTGWNAIFENAISETVGYIRDLKERGLAPLLFVLTNSNETHRLKWQSLFSDELLLFDKVYCSSQLGTRKPESRVYLEILEEWELSPSEVLFVDDKKENTEAAERLGISTVLFNDPQSGIAKLSQMVNAV